MLGLPLAFRKAQRGANVDYIGGSLSWFHGGVDASINEQRVQELKSLTNQILSSNVLSKKELRSYVGKCESFASLLFMWRPFLSELWAALHAVPGGKCPANCIWVKMIEAPTLWIKAFLHGQAGSIIRRFMVSSYMRQCGTVRIAVDASPWGLGAILIIDGRLSEYFADMLSDFDIQFFGHQLGSAEGQQTWEALAMLVALRCWSKYWQEDRVQLEVTGDNLGVLSMVSKMRSAGKGSNMIAREIALDLANGVFRPQMCEHTPGICNVLPDALSRKYQPGSNFALPAPLQGVKEICLPARSASYFKAFVAVTI